VKGFYDAIIIGKTTTISYKIHMPPATGCWQGICQQLTKENNQNTLHQVTTDSESNNKLF